MELPLSGETDGLTGAFLLQRILMRKKYQNAVKSKLRANDDLMNIEHEGTSDVSYCPASPFMQFDH